ncbi:MAG TPA: Bax inhibitor-1/YccA family protein [Candidatus Acidoferrales bacterium]|jgi:uncharacterized YccA/Bax inhibitor family protein|nr:Bax inhibitor-1/YccA family protein [Candidatus Acidoferrales bacterium]
MPQLMRTSNPALNDQAFRGEHAAFGEQAMTVKGTVNKTGILLLCAVATAAWTWNIFLHTHTAEAVGPLALVGVIGGLIFAIATIFKKTWAPVTAPLYALCEGLVLGSVSAILELRFPGIAIEAVSLTFGTLVCLLLAYRSGLIRVTDKFRLGVVAATGGIALFYVIEMVLGLFHINFVAVNGAGAIGIGFSVFVVIIASLNLVLDFDFIENGARAGVPKYMEWYGAFGLMVTLIWLYFEILQLLSKLRSRNQ